MEIKHDIDQHVCHKHISYSIDSQHETCMLFLVVVLSLLLIINVKTSLQTIVWPSSKLENSLRLLRRVALGQRRKCELAIMQINVQNISLYTC